jgi:hypothetical protein
MLRHFDGENLTRICVACVSTAGSRETRLEAVSKSSNADHRTREVHESINHGDIEFMSKEQSSKVARPCDGSFDCPSSAITPKLASVRSLSSFSTFAMNEHTTIAAFLSGLDDSWLVKSVDRFDRIETFRHFFGASTRSLDLPRLRCVVCARRHGTGEDMQAP